MKAVVLEGFGEPAEVLQVRDCPAVEPGRGQVRITMRASPVNPSDLLVVRGRYGRLPELPARLGFEGVGIVEKAGPGLVAKLRGLRPGRRVVVLNAQGGNWAEQVVVPARNLVPIPDDLPDDQGAMFFVNPATALAMTQYVLHVPAGGWLLQTAAGSALGRMIIRLGKHLGFRTINVVRRAEQAEELSRLGADVVLSCALEAVPARVREVTNGEGVLYAVDAVGGQTGLAAAHSLGRNGRLLVYGTLSAQPIPLDLRTLMVGQRKIEGFWLSEWARDQGMLTMLRLFRQIIKLLRAGVLTSEVSATFPLEQVRQAAAKAEEPGRHGKVLLWMQ